MVLFVARAAAKEEGLVDASVPLLPPEEKTR
jgi:hypothetical protein